MPEMYFQNNAPQDEQPTDTENIGVIDEAKPPITESVPTKPEVTQPKPAPVPTGNIWEQTRPNYDESVNPPTIRTKQAAKSIVQLSSERGISLNDAEYQYDAGKLAEYAQTINELDHPLTTWQKTKNILDKALDKASEYKSRLGMQTWNAAVDYAAEFYGIGGALTQNPKATIKSTLDASPIFTGEEWQKKNNPLAYEGHQQREKFKQEMLSVIRPFELEAPKDVPETIIDAGAGLAKFMSVLYALKKIIPGMPEVSYWEGANILGNGNPGAGALAFGVFGAAGFIGKGAAATHIGAVEKVLGKGRLSNLALDAIETAPQSVAMGGAAAVPQMLAGQPLNKQEILIQSLIPFAFKGIEISKGKLSNSPDLADRIAKNTNIPADKAEAVANTMEMATDPSKTHSQNVKDAAVAGIEAINAVKRGELTLYEKMMESEKAKEAANEAEKPSGKPVASETPITEADRQALKDRGLDIDNLAPEQVKEAVEAAKSEISDADYEAMKAVKPPATIGQAQRTQPQGLREAEKGTPAGGKAETPKAASMKMMLTQADRQGLRDLGYTDEQISGMTPQQGGDILASKTQAEAVTSSELPAVEAGGTESALPQIVPDYIANITNKLDTAYKNNDVKAIQVVLDDEFKNITNVPEKNFKQWMELRDWAGRLKIELQERLAKSPSPAKVTEGGGEINKAKKISDLTLDQSVMNTPDLAQDEMGGALLIGGILNKRFGEHIDVLGGETRFSSKTSIDKIKSILSKDIGFYIRKWESPAEKRGAEKAYRHIQEQFQSIEKPPTPISAKTEGKGEGKKTKKSDKVAIGRVNNEILNNEAYKMAEEGIKTLADTVPFNYNDPIHIDPKDWGEIGDVIKGIPLLERSFVKGKRGDKNFAIDEWASNNFRRENDGPESFDDNKIIGRETTPDSTLFVEAILAKYELSQGKWGGRVNETILKNAMVLEHPAKPFLEWSLHERDMRRTRMSNEEIAIAKQEFFDKIQKEAEQYDEWNKQRESEANRRASEQGDENTSDSEIARVEDEIERLESEARQHEGEADNAEIDNFFVGLEESPPEPAKPTTNLFGREELKGGASGNQSEMFNKGNFKTEQARQADESNRLDIEGQLKLSPEMRRQKGSTIFFDPQEYIRLVKGGKYLLGKGFTKFEDWANKLEADFGISDRQKLEKVWGAIGGDKREAEAKETPISPTPESVKPSGIALDTRIKAIEAGMEKAGLDKVTGYRPGSLKEQAKMVADITAQEGGHEKMMRIGLGKEDLPANMEAKTPYWYVEDWAMKHSKSQDVSQIMRDLVNSPRAREVSELGRGLALSNQGIDPDRPSAAKTMNEVQAVMEKTAEKKLKGQRPDKAKAEIKNKLAENIAKTKPSKFDLMNLLDLIVC